jgi:trigger factor
MKIGEEKDIDITFPEDYTPELAGKAVVFKVKLNSLTTPELPELDDEFAKDVSEFDTLDEYKASIRENLTKSRTERADADFRNEIMRQAVENISADIPEVMIEEKVEDILRNYASQFGMRDRNVSLDELKKMMGISDEAMETSIRPAALFQVKNDLLLDAVMDAEELADTDEAFAAYVEKTAQDIGATAEQLKQYFGEDFMRHEFRKELATNLIVDSAAVKAE